MYDPKLKLFFEPETIVIVGASAKPMSPGNIILRNLLNNKKKGLLRARIYGVNIKGGEFEGHKFYRSVGEIGDKLDHAVIVIPSRFVPKALEECGRVGVKVATIVSGGFSEVGNVELERELLEVASKYGIRIVGPNGLGIYDPYTGVDTLFIPEYKTVGSRSMVNLPRPPKGHIAFLSQSGALGGVILDYLAGENLGVSKFVSWGNKIDVDEPEMLEYLMEDDRTRGVALYIESVKKNGRKLVEVGKKFSAKKPIVVQKGGVTEAGSRAAMSHTAALTGEYRVYYGAFKQMGAVIADGVLDMIDKIKALIMQPPAKGSRVGIVSNGGGPGIVLTDALEKRGLVVPKFSDELVGELKRLVSEGIIPEIASIQNPIDLSGTAGDQAYVEATKLLIDSEEVDIVAVLLLHHPPTLTTDLPYKVLEVVKGSRKPVLVLDIGLGELSVWVRKIFDENGIPSYSIPDRIANAIQAIAQYGLWLKRRGLIEDYLENWQPIKGA